MTGQRVRGPLLVAVCLAIAAAVHVKKFIDVVEPSLDVVEPSDGVRGPSLTKSLYLVSFVAFGWAVLVIFVPVVWILLLRRGSVEIRLDVDSCNREFNLIDPPLALAAATPASTPAAAQASATRAAAPVSSVSAASPIARAPPGVLIASIEHVVMSEGIAVVAGGLGKAMKMYVDYSRHTPRRIKFVFPMVGDQDYGQFSPDDPILEGSVGVHTLRPGSRVEYVALDHPLFRERDRQSIYPDTRQPHQVTHFSPISTRPSSECDGLRPYTARQMRAQAHTHTHRD